MSATLNDNGFPTSAGMSGTSTTSTTDYGTTSSNTVNRVAQKAHTAVDQVEQKLAGATDKVMTMQEEYGSMARDYVREKPLQAVAGAFAIGIVFSKLFMR